MKVNCAWMLRFLYHHHHFVVLPRMHKGLLGDDVRQELHILMEFGTDHESWQRWREER